MATSDSEFFRELPPLAIDSISSLHDGAELPLLLMSYTENGVGVIFPIRYVHERFAGGSADQFQATAYGQVSLAGFEKAGFVTIDFSRVDGKATLRGLPFEGEVKAGRPAFNSLDEFLASLN